MQIVDLRERSHESVAPVGGRRPHLPAWRPQPRTAAWLGITGLVIVGVLLRLEGQQSWFWLDEALSVGISSHPLTQIPHLLRQDGSPPLYYLLLHGWMNLFGRSELATHVLSLVFAVAMVPVGWWAGRSLFGRRSGWFCALLAATSPYLTTFSRETRMYTLVALLTLVAITAFIHVFVFGRRRYLALFIGSLVLLAYTHNWGLYVGIALGVAVAPCLLARPDRRRVLIYAAIGFGAVAVLYLPWLPTLLFQSRHTGAPWSKVPLLREALTAIDVAIGDAHERVLVALVLVAGVVLWDIARRYRTAEGAAVIVVGIALTGEVGLAWVVAHTQPAWADRYFGIFLAPLLLICAVGLARAGRRGTVALVLVLIFFVQPLARVTGLRKSVGLKAKGDDRALIAAVAPQLRPGDVAVSIQMEEVPQLAYYLPSTIRLATPLGLVYDPTVVNWIDATDRLERATPAQNFTPLLASMHAGQRVLVKCNGVPPPPNKRKKKQLWFRLMDNNCVSWLNTVVADPSFQPVAAPTTLARVDPAAPSYVRVFERV